ncbi:MAG: hypothetical protein JWO38_1099 [Gemmataceae bacterium]|nr:hypothetical protein [Gemmataceae bacterium]
MNSHTLLSGETIEYPDPPPKVAAFLDRVRGAAADPGVSVGQLVALIYGLKNPLLDTTVLLGRAMVTKAASENPVFRVMADQIGVKQGIGPAATPDACTVSVPAAAEQLGIAPAAVRAAISCRKLGAVLRNGQWYMRPEAVATYKVSTRGRKTAVKRGPGAAASPPAAVRCVVGNDPGRSLSVKVVGGEFVREGNEGNRTSGHFGPGWTKAVVKTTSKTTPTRFTTRTGADTSFRVFVLEPAAGEDDITHGGFHLRGPFRVVQRVNNPTAANELWASLPGTGSG